jgi:hypothetical protein
MTARCLSSLFLGIACIGALGCDEKLSSLAGPTPTLEPTFASIQNDIFQTTDSSGRTRCLNCHTSVGRTPSGGLSLDPNGAYEQLVNAPSARKPGAIRVIPGDPDNSYVVQKLEGAAGIVGARMPFNSPSFLTDGQMKILRRWIAIGAPR